MAARPAKPKQGKQKIEIAYINKQTPRKQTFRKRNAGLFKKAYELSVLSGAQVTLKVDQNEKRGKSELYHYCSWKPDNENKLPCRLVDTRRNNDNNANFLLTGAFGGLENSQQELQQEEVEEEEESQQQQPQQQQVLAEDLNALLDDDGFEVEDFLSEALASTL